jgi:hypothetical protein
LLRTKSLAVSRFAVDSSANVLGADLKMAGAVNDKNYPSFPDRFLDSQQIRVRIRAAPSAAAALVQDALNAARVGASQDVVGCLPDR